MFMRAYPTHDQTKQNPVTFLKPTCHLNEKAFSGFLNSLRLGIPPVFLQYFQHM